MEASTIPTGTVIEAVAQESTLGGSAVETRRTAADSFDYSYFLVLTLGIAGLFWVRRQSQAL
jgi:hypothetical protein